MKLNEDMHQKITKKLNIDLTLLQEGVNTIVQK
jgi:hypothetical protein